MHTQRTDRDGWTEIRLQSAYSGRYYITCMDVDLDEQTGERQPPTVHISLLSLPQADVAQTRRLAAEYADVADVAEALEREKRAAYAETPAADAAR